MRTVSMKTACDALDISSKVLDTWCLDVFGDYKRSFTLEDIKRLKAAIDAEKEKEKDTFKEDPKEDPMDIKDAFKNLFA